MDTQESLAVFGNTFTITYYNGSDYIDATATYTGSTRQLQDSVGDLPIGLECLQYTAPVSNLSTNPQYITCRFFPQYSINQTSQIHTALFLYAGITSAAVPPYHTPTWDWIINGSDTQFEGPLINNDSQLDIARVGVDSCFYVNVDYGSQDSFSASSFKVSFIAPVGVDSGKVWLYLAPPYISQNATAENGIVSGITTSSSGSTNIDMSQTNNILTNILSGISDLGDIIVDGIADLFIPEQNTITAFENALADLLMDTFGGIESDMLDSTIQDLLTHGATESVTWPAISVPGTSFSLPAYNVPLKPHAVQNRALYEAVALAIDLVSTAAVINLIFHTIKVILVGEKVVEVEDAD